MSPLTMPISAETTLILKRTIAAPRVKVFDAWTNPALLTQWFFPTDEHVSPLVEVDLRVGGKYRMVMKHVSKGIVHVATGFYREIHPPSRLVFSWSWEGEQPPAETLVTVELHDLGASTEVVLKHESFQTKESRDQHEMGWTGKLGHLITLLQK